MLVGFFLHGFAWWLDAKRDGKSYLANSKCFPSKHPVCCLIRRTNLDMGKVVASRFGRVHYNQPACERLSLTRSLYPHLPSIFHTTPSSLSSVRARLAGDAAVTHSPRRARRWWRGERKSAATERGRRGVGASVTRRVEETTPWRSR